MNKVQQKKKEQSQIVKQKIYYGFEEEEEECKYHEINTLPSERKNKSQSNKRIQKNKRIHKFQRNKRKIKLKGQLVQSIQQIELNISNSDDNHWCEEQQIERTNLKRKKRKIITISILKNIQKYFRIFNKQSINGVNKNQKITFQIISKQLDICLTQVRKLYQEYLIDPFFAYRKNTLVKKKNNYPNSSKLMQNRMQTIGQLLKNDCVLTQQEIANQLNKHTTLKGRDKNGNQIDISKKIVSSLLKQAKYSKKKLTMIPKDRNTIESIERRRIYCQQYRKIQKDPNNKIYYLDQSGFNMFTIRNQGWAKIGEKAYKVVPTTKGKNIILLAIIGKQGLIDYELSDGYNAAKFCEVFQKMVARLFTNLNSFHHYIVMDNCPIHHKQNMLSIQQQYKQQQKNIHIMFLPPYAPMLNPIQNWFNQIKIQVKSQKYKTRQQLKKVIKEILSHQLSKSLEPYYRNIEKYLDLGCASVAYL